jgi:phosphoribosyl 1,2-cyclic phosphodiesterase
MTSSIRTTFWGVRGGLPVPGPTTVEFGGNTTCLEVRAGSHLIIIDAGTGIIGLGAKLKAERRRTGRPIVGTLLFTHGHHDHTQGLSLFAPLRFGDSCFHILGPQVFGLSLKEVLKLATVPSMYPTTLDQLCGMCTIRDVRENQSIVLLRPGAEPVVHDLDMGSPFIPPGAVYIQIYHSCHHPRGGSLVYSIEYSANPGSADSGPPKKLVFATDTEGYEGGDQRLIRLAQGADLLIHDAEYTDREYTGPPLVHQGWGHSTWRMAVDVGQQAQVKRLALTHHNAQHDDAFLRDVEQEVQAVFPQAFFVREGTTIEL